MTVDRHVAPVHGQRVLVVRHGRRPLFLVMKQHVRARRVSHAPALVALTFPGRPGTAVTVFAVHLLRRGLVEAVHAPRLPAVLAARVRTLAPLVRQPTVVYHGRWDQGRGQWD